MTDHKIPVVWKDRFRKYTASWSDDWDLRKLITSVDLDFTHLSKATLNAMIPLHAAFSVDEVRKLVFDCIEWGWIDSELSKWIGHQLWESRGCPAVTISSMTKGETTDADGLANVIDQIIFWHGHLYNQVSGFGWTGFNITFTTHNGVGICLYHFPPKRILTVYTAPTRKLLLAHMKLLYARQVDILIPLGSQYDGIVALKILIGHLEENPLLIY